LLAEQLLKHGCVESDLLIGRGLKYDDGDPDLIPVAVSVDVSLPAIE